MKKTPSSLHEVARGPSVVGQAGEAGLSAGGSGRGEGKGQASAERSAGKGLLFPAGRVMRVPVYSVVREEGAACGRPARAQPW